MHAPDPSSDASRVSIGAVIDELGGRHPSVTHSSLRFLEREGLVTPMRTAGGHRLYARSDIRRIDQIKNWQAQGLSLQEIRDRLDKFDRLAPDELGLRILDAALDGRGDEAARLVLEADSAGLPLVQLMRDILQPALVILGDRWAAGEISVAQEKEVSEMMRALIAEVGQRHAAPPPLTGPVILAACVEGERHDLGLRMLLALLAAEGWNLHFLGADVAPRFLGEAIRLRRPDHVLLSATIDDHLSALAPAIAEIRRVCNASPPRILAGGPAVSRHPEQVRAMGAEPIIEQSVDQVLALLAPT